MTAPTLEQTIAANISAVRARIAAAAARVGRDPAGIRLVGVSKTFPPEMVAAAVRAGLADIGENRVQEAVAKRAALEAAGLRPVWHLVGHLQTNKVKPALQTFDILHSIDSVRLAEALNRHATRPVDVLIEVNVAGEATKFGFAPEEVEEALRYLQRLDHLRVHGLMTVAPQVADPEQVRPVFRALRALRDATGLAELSMGMTDDFEVAVEEGATIVRIGRAIFGPRPMTDEGD